MSYDHKQTRYCDECGRTIEKAHRIFQGYDYCSTCYPRVFPKVECSLCGGAARSHRYSKTDPICRSCDIKTRKCLRCEKAVPRAGKVINGKPVCPSCAPYFNEPQLCSSCGQLSKRVTRLPKLGLDNPMCDACRRKVTHATCSFCRKHRSVHGITDDGKEYCVSCIPGHQQYHPCPSCGVSLPGKGLSRCRSCLNLTRLVREADLHSLTLNRAWARELLVEFTIWLHGRSGHQPNCFKIFTSHETFFERIDAEFPALTDIHETSILDRLGVTLLRKHLLVSTFLQERLGISFRAEAKEDSAEKARIQEKLIKNIREPWAPLLTGYESWLSNEKVTVRTKRLYLRAAENFCQTEKLKSDAAWGTNALPSFLKKNPGSRASLFRFVSYCRVIMKWEVEVPSRPQSSSSSLPKKLKSLIAEVNVKGIEAVDLDVLNKILALAFGYQYRDFTEQSWDLIEVEGVPVLIGNEKMAVPTGYLDIVRGWLSRRKYSEQESS